MNWGVSSRDGRRSGGIAHDQQRFVCFRYFVVCCCCRYSMVFGPSCPFDASGSQCGLSPMQSEWHGLGARLPTQTCVGVVNFERAAVASIGGAIADEQSDL